MNRTQQVRVHDASSGNYIKNLTYNGSVAKLSPTAKSDLWPVTSSVFERKASTYPEDMSSVFPLYFLVSAQISLFSLLR
ncbi:MAG: hypothetical protein SGJ02_08810 [bacterium]|nr:hypothetical protein [bacterium]